jgi:hypothetical protein
MIQIRFKDVDPDTGEISQDKLICICQSDEMTRWVLYGLHKVQEEEDQPNREIYTIKGPGI